MLNKHRVRKYVFKAIFFIILIAGALCCLFPFLWMVSASLKLEKELYQFPIDWIPDTIRWSNYPRVFEIIPFGIYFLNTLKLAIIITTLQVITSALAAYAFSKLEFRGRNKIFLCYLSTLMIPFQVTMIPQFIMMSKYGLTNTHTALILIGAFSTFGVFLLRQFFLTIPNEILESARIDGCGELKILVRIVSPMAKASYSSLIVFTFVSTWNDYLAPLIYISSDTLKTIQLGIRYFQQATSTDNNLLMAATCMGLVPVLIIYFLCQRQFIEGIASSGVKG